MNTQMNFKLTLFLLSLFFTHMLHAQGWEYVYPSPSGTSNSNFSRVSDVLVSNDDAYIGLFSRAPFTNRVQVVKVDEGGNEIWNRQYGKLTLLMEAIINTVDNGYAMVGNSTIDSDQEGMALYKLSSMGDSLWMKTFGCCGDRAKDVVQTTDGGYFIVGAVGHSPTTLDSIKAVAIKTNENGDLIWSRTYFGYPVPGQANGADGFNRVIVRSNGNYLTAGGVEGVIYLTELNDVGDVIWQMTVPNPGNFMLRSGDIEETNDGGILVSGYDQNTAPVSGGHLWKFDSDGVLLWSDFTTTNFDAPISLSENASGDIYIGRNKFIEHRDSEGNIICQFNEDGERDWLGSRVEATPDGGAIIAASRNLLTEYHSTLLKINNCEAAIDVIKGNVNIDENGDCVEDTPGAGLKNWLVELNDGVYSYFQLSDEEGDYSFNVNEGDFTLTLHPPMSYWESCAQGVNISVGSSPDTVTQDLQGIILEECPFLFVDLASSPLRPCFDRNASISYSNLGTDTAFDATLIFSIDNLISITSASESFVALPDNEYEFQLGNLAPGDIGNISFELFTDCDAPIGQELCLQANVYPDTLCGTFLWAGAVIDVNGNCDGDTIDFEIKNIGEANMVAPLDFIVTEDDVMYMQGSFDLEVEESIEIQLPNNHATYITQADQEPGYPFGEFAIDVVAFCESTNGSEPFSFGFFNQFPLNNATPTEDIECVPTVNSFDPNQKLATPQGYGEEHLIESNTLLEYHIDFQNTGTDTAYNIVIRDTLSSFLDIFSLRAGAGSHPYQLDVEENGILVFTFPDIYLVDSVANEPASHGFVEYQIMPRNDLANGAVIENTAAIFFDFNPPIFTNTTWHTIGENFVIVEVDETYRATLNLDIYPNPATPYSTLRLLGGAPQNADLKLYNPMGQAISVSKFAEGEIHLDQIEMTSGMYFFQIWENGTLYGTGKLMVK